VYTEPPGAAPEPHACKAVLLNRGITIRTAARYLGMNEVYLGRVLNGWNPVSRHVREGFSRLLGMPEADLFRPPEPSKAPRLSPGRRPRPRLPVATSGGDAA
jgi:hypothetical protein